MSNDDLGLKDLTPNIIDSWEHWASERPERLVAQTSTERQVVALCRAVRSLRAALLAVRTDDAQDTVEDPVGHADREKAGFHRIGRGAMEAVREALEPRDLVAYVMQRAAAKFGPGNGRDFNAATFSIAWSEVTGLRGGLDGLAVAAMLHGRRDVQRLPPYTGAHYRITEGT